MILEHQGSNDKLPHADHPLRNKFECLLLEISRSGRIEQITMLIISYDDMCVNVYNRASAKFLITR